jgi:hypothetical protein
MTLSWEMNYIGLIRDAGRLDLPDIGQSALLTKA